MRFHLRRLGLPALLASLLLVSLKVAPGCSATGDPKDFNTGGGGSSGNPGPAGTGGTGGIDIGFDAGHGGKTPGGGVPQTCAEALEAQSYIGCEYWPTVTSNAGLYDQFEFAVAAANPTASSATVTVERAGAVVAQVNVAPGDLQTIPLPWVVELKGEDLAGDGSGITSRLLAKGAYKVTSSVPITLYQFNPLEFELTSPPPDCPLLPETGKCSSYTNDASLLLPKTALRGDYYVMSYPTLHLGYFDIQWIDLPGIAAITATEDGTTVEVTSTANVRSGPGVGALSPGQKGTYTLNAGDVLQLASAAGPSQQTPQPGKPCEDDATSGITKCPSAANLDLTGTHIVANKPVSVISGHDCTFVPYNRYACDHIEESMFPVEALGQDLIVTAPRSVLSLGGGPGQPDNMYVRVLSAADNNKITFDPPVNPGVTLNAGKWIEIGPVQQDFRVLGSDKLLVAQYSVGENFSSDTGAGAGDPDLSVAIPTEQYRLEYVFLAPSTYTYNLVNVVAPTGETVVIDGVQIPGGDFSPIGGTGMSVARYQIGGGTHKAVGSKNFGIVVYGYGSYTSYMYPGGLNLETIIIVPE
jgi:hypothetical protein